MTICIEKHLIPKASHALGHLKIMRKDCICQSYVSIEVDRYEQRELIRYGIPYKALDA